MFTEEIANAAAEEFRRLQTGTVDSLRQLPSEVVEHELSRAALAYEQVSALANHPLPQLTHVL